jgi:excisionase family DNA binding protein
MANAREGSTEMLTVPEAADEKGVHPHSIRRAIKAGRLPAIQKGNYWLIQRGDLEKWKVVGHRPKRRPEESA